MNVILDKLREIRLKPRIYLAEPTVIFLKTFIDGYAIRERELNGDADCEMLEGFQRYVENKYQEKLSISWATIISKHCESEEETFSVFFDLLDEYVKENQSWIE